MSQPNIHPTAIVSDDARIGDGTVVGPYCIIGPHVEIGMDCSLRSHVTIEGPTRIGNGNRFYPYASIGQQTQDLKYDGEPTRLEMGDGNTFRECATVHRATARGGTTRVGSHGNFLAYAHIAHDCTVGDHVIFSNNGTLAGHVEVGDHAVIGGLTAVHQFCRIGRHAITGGCSKIVQDVPPYFIADGNPAQVRGVNSVGLQRRGFDEEVVKSLRRAYKLIYKKDLPTSKALDAIRESITPAPEITHLLEFIEQSQRGIIR